MIKYLLVIVVLCSGCFSTRSIFISYPSQMATVKKDIMQDALVSAKDHLNHGIESQDAILYLQERGRIHQLANNWAHSIQDFEKAAHMIEENTWNPTLSVSKLSSQLQSILINDNMIPYPGYSYEKIFIHTYQALNFLQSKNLESALVEIRKANNTQRYIQEDRAFKLAALKENAKQQNIDYSGQETILQELYKTIDPAIGNAKKDFHNAYTDCISGILYAMQKDYNNASVSFRKALELYPQNTALQNLYLATQKNHLANQSQLIILYEEGFVPEKQEIRFSIPIDGRIYTLALPYYSKTQPSNPLTIQINNHTLSTQTLCHPQELAAASLKEDYPAIVLRHILRLVIRDRIQKDAQNLDQQSNTQGFLSLSTGLLGMFIDKADRRSWLTLPKSIQIANTYLTPGIHTLLVQDPSLSIDIEIKPQSIHILRIIRTGPTVYTQYFPK